jgi:hypothetical protein
MNRQMVNSLSILLISASFTSNVLAHELTGDLAGMHHHGLQWAGIIVAALAAVFYLARSRSTRSQS